MAVIKHLNKYELAKRWFLVPRTIDRWRADGIGPKYLKLGGRVLYRLEDIEEYEKGSIVCPRCNLARDHSLPLSPADLLLLSQVSYPNIKREGK